MREHLFFHCMEIPGLEIGAISQEGIMHLTESFEEWQMKICLAHQGNNVQERTEITVYLLWYIWKARCAWQFEGHRWETREIVQKSMLEWQEFKVHSKQSSKKGSHQSS